MYGNFYGGFGAVPGLQGQNFTGENTFYWNNHALNVFDQGQIDSATVDSGNTKTTILRPGLLLGKIFSSGKVKHWDPTAVDGSQYVWAVLENPAIGMADSLGTAKERWGGRFMIRGAVKPQKLLIPGQASFGVTGNAYEYLIRDQLHRLGFLIMDDPIGTALMPLTRFGGSFGMVQAKTADYTVKAYESGTLFTNRGASADINFTLPATPLVGLHYGFYLVENYEIKLTSGTADTIVAFNDKGCDTVAITTNNAQIGSMLEVFGDGTGWLTRVSPAQAISSSGGGSDVAIVTVTT